MSVNTTRQWALAGKKARARSEAVRGAIREAVDSAAERGVAGIRFASQSARELALDSGLTWATFDGLTASGARGYTVADVRALRAFEDETDG